MTNQPRTTPESSIRAIQEPGFWEKQVSHAKVFWKCFTDRRVSFFLKLAYLGGSIVGVITYWVVPDLIPGPLDDLFVSTWAIPFVLSYVFIELCPGWIVNKHRRAIEEEDKAEPEDGA